MPWVKLDDHFDEHPKIAAVGPLGLALWVVSIAYCNRNLTDGFIPRSVADRLVDWTHPDDEGRPWLLGITKSKDSDATFSPGCDVDSSLVIDTLLEGGIWHEVQGGYRIHDYSDYQPSKSDVLADRARSAERQKKSRERRSQGESQRDDSVSHGEVTGNVTLLSPVRHTGPVPVPNPVPKGSKSKSMNGSTSSVDPSLRCQEHDPNEHLVAKLVVAIGSDGDEGTERVLRGLARRLPDSSLAKALESVQTRPVRDRAAYVVGSLQSELKEATA